MLPYSHNLSVLMIKSCSQRGAFGDHGPIYIQASKYHDPIHIRLLKVRNPDDKAAQPETLVY